MKTSKQHAQEITYKIEREISRKRTVKQRTLKAVAFSLALGLFLPATVYASASIGKKAQPAPSAPLSDTVEENERESDEALPKNEKIVFSKF
jgi:hypothetical protein